MLRRSGLGLISKNRDGKAKRSIPGMHKYKELSRWQREASGLTDFEDKQSHLRHNHQEHRFNPNFVGLTKGTTAEETQKWIHHDQMKLPQLAPDDYVAPVPMGRAAWPSSWTEDVASKVLALTDAELRQFATEQLVETIFEEAQRDGIELRRLDMEGNPMSELPEISTIENYVLEETTLRDRVIERVIEGSFGFQPDSVQRANLRSVPDILDYLAAKVTSCRIPKRVRVTNAVLDFLAAQPIQPEFGYQHVIPQDTRKALVIAWEQEFHYKWQHGNAVFSPRDREEDQLTPAFCEAKSKIAAREAFEQDRAANKLREAHMAKIREAASR